LLHYQPCVSPVWDTAIAVNALVDSGLPADHPQLQLAAEWMIDKQITVPGDWQVKRPHVPRVAGRFSTTMTSILTSTTRPWS
jgi:squalene cyclase